MVHLDLERTYVSPFDRFFYKYDATHPKTASQLKEIKKHQRIAALRDNVSPGGDEEIIWQSF